MTSQLTLGAWEIVYKPSGSNSVSPYLLVDDAGAAIEFMKTVFDAVDDAAAFVGDDGRVMHAEVRIDDSVVMLGKANDAWPAVLCLVHVYVPDVDATYKRALHAGAESVHEPMKADDEDKRGGVRDRLGTTWWIATKVE